MHTPPTHLDPAVDEHVLRAGELAPQHIKLGAHAHDGANAVQAAGRGQPLAADERLAAGGWEDTWQRVSGSGTKLARRTCHTEACPWAHVLDGVSPVVAGLGSPASWHHRCPSHRSASHALPSPHPLPPLPPPFPPTQNPSPTHAPVRQLMVVVLPAPLGPSRQNTWSWSMENHESLIAQKSRSRCWCGSSWPCRALRMQGIRNRKPLHGVRSSVWAWQLWQGSDLLDGEPCSTDRCKAWPVARTRSGRPSQPRHPAPPHRLPCATHPTPPSPPAQLVPDPHPEGGTEHFLQAKHFHCGQGGHLRSQAIGHACMG